MSKVALKIDGLGVCGHYQKRAEPGILTLLETMAAAKKEGGTEKERQKAKEESGTSRTSASINFFGFSSLCVLRRRNTGMGRKWERGWKGKDCKEGPPSQTLGTGLVWAECQSEV